MKKLTDFSSHSFSRRTFLKYSAGVFAFSYLAPEWEALAAYQRMIPLPEDRKIGIALVGLGNYSAGQLAPALQETKLCRLAGIVTGTPEKAERWAKQYKIPEKNIYTYQNFDQIKNNKDIDVVYVVLPNGMHAEYTIRAAKAGKHVISEKPMATTVKDCQDMITACQENKRMLSIGYRLHFEPYNLEMMRLGQKEVFGPVKKLVTENGFTIGDPSHWRLNKKLGGGGPLMDMGIYCVQGVQYTLGKTPASVTATFGEKTQPDKFKEVEESISWQFQFPGGAVADSQTSYAKGMSRLRAEAAKGWFELQSAYGYSGQRGETSKGKMDFPHVNQQARQMDGFADCVLRNKKTIVPGEMGLRDVKILLAIYKAAETGKKVAIV